VKRKWAERRTEKRIGPWSRIRTVDKDEKWKPAVVRERFHHILNSLLGAGLNSILTLFKALEYNPHFCNITNIIICE